MRDVENPMTSINHPIFEDEEILAHDVFGQEIYEGDEYYDFGDIVHEDNLKKYFENELRVAESGDNWW